MLTLTEPAASMLNDARSEQGIPEHSLLRIAAPADGGNGISLTFVEHAAEGDQTSDAHGLNYCVAPEVAEELDRAAIDLREPSSDATVGWTLVIVPVD